MLTSAAARCFAVLISRAADSFSSVSLSPAASTATLKPPHATGSAQTTRTELLRNRTLGGNATVRHRRAGCGRTKQQNASAAAKYLQSSARLCRLPCLLFLLGQLVLELVDISVVPGVQRVRVGDAVPQPGSHKLQLALQIVPWATIVRRSQNRAAG